MIRFKDDLNKELSHINCTAPSTEIIAKARPIHKPTAYIPRIAAAAVVLVLLAGICFAPNLFGTKENSFTIYAGAEELSSKYFVDLNSNDPNYIKFNFNYILDEDAEPTDITRRYLFHSFSKQLNLSVTGEDIETITYKINQGSITASKYDPTIGKNGVLNFKNTYSNTDSSIVVDYTDQSNWNFSFNPVLSDAEFYSNKQTYIALAGTGRITTINEFAVLDDNGMLLEVKDHEYICEGYMLSDAPLATEEEIEKLRSYAKADDMIGFYNYQNEVFERIIDEITLSVTVTKTDGTTETKTVQLCYTPTEVTSLENLSDSPSETLSNGTISAKLIEN